MHGGKPKGAACNGSAAGLQLAREPSLAEKGFANCLVLVYM